LVTEKELEQVLEQVLVFEELIEKLDLLWAEETGSHE
jgi:hypothetical protein